MAFTPNPGETGSTGDSSGDGAANNSLAAAFGTEEQRSEAVDSAKAFRDAAKSGKFRIDPDAAKAAIKELLQAEETVRGARRRAEALSQRPKIGSSPYSAQASGWYAEGGESCRNAVVTFVDVLRHTREGYEHAVRSYESIESDRSQTFDQGLWA